MKKRKIEIGSMWQRKDTTFNKHLYIVIGITKHPYAADSVSIKGLDVFHLPNSEISVSADYFKEEFRRLA